MELTRGLELLGLDLDAHQASQLETLLDGVEKWNRVYNLTRITRRQDMVIWTEHLLSPGGRILALKGQYPADEIAKTREIFPQAQVDSIELAVPGLDAERFLIEVKLH